jgi:protein RecA
MTKSSTRRREKVDVERASTTVDNYLVGDKPNLSFVSTGCTLLDCALGGGLVLGRICNIVGDKSTAKTALATEALINFVSKYPDGKAAYRDAEAAFDREYAQAMGLPLAKIDFGDKELDTVEEFSSDFERFVDGCAKSGQPGMYVLDSLDALSDAAEMEAQIGTQTYGTAKAKNLSIFFRKMKGKTERAKVLLLIVSQVRDNIGAMFGEKHKRSGGRALDFYASQVLWLSHIKTLKRTIKKVERPYGVIIKAKVKKNKVGLAFREAEFAFKFGFGVDDLEASIGWLKEVGQLDRLTEVPDAYLNRIESLTDQDYRKEVHAAAVVVKTVWREIETTFLPTRKKYA